MADRLITVVPPQTKFFKNLCESLGVSNDNPWMSILGLSLGGSVVGTEIDESKITPQGCLLMSSLVQFKVSSVQSIVSHARVLFDHLASADIESSRFFNDMGPGRLLQNIMSRESCFPSNMKMKLIRQVLLADNSVQRVEKLASDKRIGAWLITTAWDSADMSTKKDLGANLLKINGLRDWNWKIWKHCELASFSRRNEEWAQSENRKDKAKSFLRDIVGDDFRSNKKCRM